MIKAIKKLFKRSEKEVEVKKETVNVVEPYKIKIDIDLLIVRKGPGEKYDEVGTVKKNNAFVIVEEVINGKRAHKYIDFACDAPGYPMASNWIKEHPGEKYTWFKGNMYCDWREGLN